MSCICESNNATYPVDVDCPLHGLAAVGPDARDHPTPPGHDTHLAAAIAAEVAESTPSGREDTGAVEQGLSEAEREALDYAVHAADCDFTDVEQAVERILAARLAASQSGGEQDTTQDGDVQ